MFASQSRPQSGGIGLAELLQLFSSQGNAGSPAGTTPGIGDGTPQGQRPGMFGTQRPPISPVSITSAPRLPAQEPPAVLQQPPPDQVPGGSPIGNWTPQSLGSLAPHIKARPFGKVGVGNDGAGWKIMGILADAMSAAGGGQPLYAQGMLDRQKREQEQNRWLAEQKLTRDKFDWEKKKDSRPDVKAVGRDLVTIPFEGDPSVLYHGTSDAENYAKTLGLKPGDEGYEGAVQDYVLGSNGPTASGYRQGLEDQRFDHRRTLKTVPTYANLHPRPGGGGRGNAGGGTRPPRNVSEVVAPILDKLRTGGTLTPAEQSALSYYSRGGGRGRGTPPINPASTAPRPSPAAPRLAAPRLPVRQSGPIRVKSVAEARALKPGTQFVTPDGKLKVR